MPDETTSDGTKSSKTVEAYSPGERVPLIRFEYPEVIRQYSTNIRYIDITFDVYNNHDKEAICKVGLRINFAKYKFESSRQHEVPFARYHEAGGFRDSQYIGFFSDLTNIRSEAYHDFSSRGLPYFLGAPVPPRGVYEMTADLYDHAFSKDREAILRVPIARNTSTRFNARGEWESEETTWFSNPISGEYVLVSNRILPIIFLSNFNVWCEKKYNRMYGDLRASINTWIKKNILIVVSGKDEFVYGAGSYMHFRNVKIQPNGGFNQDDIDLIEQSSNSFDTLMRLLSFYYQLQYTN